MYLHKTLNGKVFYVGKGRENRAWNKSRRSKAWNECAANGFSVEKHGNEEAFRLACEWRSEQIRLLNEQGAGYTERHGT